MKVLLAVLALVACAVAEEGTDLNKEQMRQECLKKHHITGDQKAKIELEDIIPNGEEPRQYLLCYLKKIGIFETELGFNVDRIFKEFKLHGKNGVNITEEVEWCISTNDKKDPDYVREVHRCLQELAFYFQDDAQNDEVPVQNDEDSEMECLTKVTLTDDQKYKMFTENIIPNEEQPRQYLLCKLKQFGIFATEGGFNVDRIIQKFKVGSKKEKSAKQYVQNCIKHYKHDKEDDAYVYEVFHCLEMVLPDY